jgi:hemoglobin-like flavoprotein
MNATDIQLVQESFQKVMPIAEQAAALFYARLFELNPSLRNLFRGDMAEQGRKLMTILGVAVGSLHRIDHLVPAVQALGARHAGYGVKEEDYATVGAALLWTLEKGLGADFTLPVRNAWSTTYALLANTMLDAQRRASIAA